MIKEYDLRTVEDFFALPDNKIEECLADFAIWLRLCRDCPELNMMRNQVVWKDDGVRGLSELRILIEGVAQ